MRLTVLAIVAIVLLTAPAACGAGEPGADASVSFNDAFDGKQLNEEFWLKGGSYSLTRRHTLCRHSLMMINRDTLPRCRA